MKINFKQPITSLDGQSIGTFKEYVVLDSETQDLVKDQNGQPLIYQAKPPKGKSLTVRDVCLASLRMRDQKEDPAKALEKFLLSKKIFANDEIKLSTSEKKMIIDGLKDVGYDNIVIGQVYELLEK